MQGLDRFDDPGLGGQEVEFEDESPLGQAKAAIEPVKKFLPQIIALIVILAIAWFAYDYFIGSMVEATINIEDTEGKSLTDNKIKVYAAGAEEPLFEGSDSPSYVVPLKAGNYKYEVDVSGYATKRGSIDITAEDNAPTITLEKDLDVEIVDFESGFPTKLYVGGTSQFTVRIKNDSSSTETIYLVAEKDLQDFELTGMDSISLPGNATQPVQIGISVPLGTELKDKREGDEKDVGIRIKYTKEAAKTKTTLYPNPAEEISLKVSKFSAKAGEKDSKDVKVDNDNRFPIEGLVLTVEITSATKNSKGEVEKWFQFSEVADQSNPQRIEISSIPGRGDVEKELQVIIPPIAKEEEGIKGNIVLNAPFLSEPIKVTLTLDVKEGAGFSIDIKSSARDSIEIEWNESAGKYEELPITMTIKNNGKIDLENISVAIANETDCSQDWLYFFGENTISSLTAGASKEIRLYASAPIARRGVTMPCNVRYWFDNPISGGFVEGMLTPFIEIKSGP